jgi:L,D-transpeptidase YcbB
MRSSYYKTALLLLCTCTGSFTATAQITAALLQQFIADDKNMRSAEVKYAGGVKEFYALLNYKTAWVQKENTGAACTLLNALNLSASLGLRKTDYQFKMVESFCNGTVSLNNKDDSLKTEISITGAAIHFYNDVAYGNTQPPLGYNGLNYKPGCHNIPALLKEYISGNRLPLLINFLSPSLPEITAIENKIKWMNTVMTDNDFSESIITSKKVNRFNKSLVLKLYQLGIIDSVNKNLPDSLLLQKVKEAQRQFSLLADGSLRTTILQELNVPVTARLQQLNLSVNYYRWLYCLVQNQSVIVVNIPAAFLKVYHGSETILEMRLIVGKKSTPTPLLASKTKEVVLYPYWHVPYRIATKELLPLIKQNPGFINAGNYQVLNMAGKITDPYSINWHALNTKYFPYVIRQSTGCDNALGVLKINFYNPFSVYLHDTPNRFLFTLNKRYFSHGCMRMEKPTELGHLVLKNNTIAIDTLEQKGCLQNKAPITVQADEHLPVIVWYNPAGIDSTGKVIFYEDVYGKFDFMKGK